tara:strand:+ start:813 stop:1424 length:612 start_codon:yes stop_codon:yes gene_type:complete
MVENERNEIFDVKDPFILIKSWMKEARQTELNDPDAVALSTVDENGMPNVRMVLLRYILRDGFLFFSNYNSQKGKEIQNSNKAAFLLHWKSLRKQVRVRGIVKKDNSELSKKYYSERGYLSKIGAWSSKQSDVLISRNKLLENVQFFKDKFRNDPPKPSFWGGYLIKPLEIEFWMDGEHRLHDRFKWSRKELDSKWTINRLYP